LYIIHTFLYHLRFAFSMELLFVCTDMTEAIVQQPMRMQGNWKTQWLQSGLTLMLPGWSDLELRTIAS
jgi:hypothetical protein